MEPGRAFRRGQNAQQAAVLESNREFATAWIEEMLADHAKILERRNKLATRKRNVLIAAENASLGR